MASGRNTSRQQKLVVNVQSLDIHGVADQHLLRELFWLDIAGLRQRMTLGHHQHLLVVKHGHKRQPRLEQWVWRDQQINLVAEQRADSAKLKLLFDVHFHIRPSAEIG